MVELGVNSHHQAEVLSYMKFARYLRGQSKTALADGFHKTKMSLFDDTYTQEEVKKILDDLESIVISDAEAEFCSFSHNNVLMLQQLFAQAEKWHLSLEVQLSELQNRELLDMIRQLEVNEAVLKPAKPSHDGDNAVALLRMEIERLRDENERQQSQQQQSADKLERTKEELNAVKEKLREASLQIEVYTKNLDEQAKLTTMDEDKVAEMSVKLQNVQKLLQVDQESSRQRQATIMNELNSTKEQIQQVRSQLKLAELELERKFSETKAYANMKQMLVSKNSQIKLLRAKISELGFDADQEEDD